MNVSELKFTANAHGYMLYYKERPIGGAGTRGKPLHWKHAQANVKGFGQDAQREIEAIKQGRGQARFLEAIARIDGEGRLT